MPIKWSALKVKEAADMVEDFLNQAAEPLECARNVALEARKIEKLPQYIEQELNSILTEIERVTGGEVTHTNYDYETETYNKSIEYVEGSIKQSIQRLRKSIPTSAVKSAEIAEKYGNTPAII